MNDINVLKNNGVDLEKSLEYLGDMETYDETIGEFINGINEKINNLNTYKNNNDMPNYAICVHSLKSDARYLGFTKLADLAFSHETESKNNNVEFVNANYALLMNEVNNTINIAKSYLQNATAKEDVVETLPVNSESILIVDDSDMVRNFIFKIFNNTFDVILANDGAKAIEILSSNKNLKGVLLDLNMPNVNGFEVLDFLKNNNLFMKYPVSIITGADDKDTITRAFQYPIIDMLQKPFNEKDVKRIIERTISYGK